MTKSQQQDEMVNAFVASIPAMQTDIALLKKDTKFLTAAAKTQSDKSDTIIDRLDKLNVVTPEQFDKYKGDSDLRFKAIEKYMADTKPGVSFANAIVSRWTTFLVLLILVGAVIVALGHFVPLGG